jgi:hypothetical protein
MARAFVGAFFLTTVLTTVTREALALAFHTCAKTTAILDTSLLITCRAGPTSNALTFAIRVALAMTKAVSGARGVLTRITTEALITQAC